MKTEELKIMAKYYNTTRPDQIVQIKDMKRNMMWYETLRQDDKNTMTEFCCSQERFVRLYAEKR